MSIYGVWLRSGQRRPNDMTGMVRRHSLLQMGPSGVLVSYRVHHGGVRMPDDSYGRLLRMDVARSVAPTSSTCLSIRRADGDRNQNPVTTEG